MDPKRHSSLLHRRSLLGRDTGRAPYGIVKPSSEAFEREMQNARELALEICWSLRRSEERLDATLQRIDATLRDLALQREQIHELEYALGSER
jgi:hypothetical protein